VVASPGDRVKKPAIEAASALRRMKTAIGSALLWVERIAKLLGIGVFLAISAAFLLWVLVVDWQVLGG
jgi:hypothetical protein